jgi:predicted nucleic acid-binding protein
MRLYVESNFLLEVVLRQEQSNPALQLLDFAGAGELEMAVPAFALIEPFWTLRARSIRRKQNLDELAREQQQWRRAPARSDLFELDASVGRLIEQVGALDVMEQSDLEVLARSLAGASRIIALEGSVIVEAISISTQTGLQMMDAIVLASVLVDLHSNPPTDECGFASRDRKGFSDASIVEKLAEQNCAYLPSFENALNFVSARIQS